MYTHFNLVTFNPNYELPFPSSGYNMFRECVMCLTQVYDQHTCSVCVHVFHTSV